jgi:hypothetical protein
MATGWGPVEAVIGGATTHRGPIGRRLRHGLPHPYHEVRDGIELPLQMNELTQLG